jgi:hypothetical protein
MRAAAAAVAFGAVVVAARPVLEMSKNKTESETSDSRRERDERDGCSKLAVLLWVRMREIPPGTFEFDPTDCIGFFHSTNGLRERLSPVIFFPYRQVVTVRKSISAAWDSGNANGTQPVRPVDWTERFRGV